MQILIEIESGATISTLDFFKGIFFLKESCIPQPWRPENLYNKYDILAVANSLVEVVALIDGFFWFCLACPIVSTINDTTNPLRFRSVLVLLLQAQGPFKMLFVLISA